MPDTENCGRIPRKIPKTWSVEVVVGEGGKVNAGRLLANDEMWGGYRAHLEM